MIIVFAIVAAVFAGLFLVALMEVKRLEKKLAASLKQVADLTAHFESETARIENEARTLIDQQLADLKQEEERLRGHFEAEARKIQEAADALVSKAIKDLEPLRKYGANSDAIGEAQKILAQALEQAVGLKSDADAILEAARSAAQKEQSEAISKAKEIRHHAETLLSQATKDAGWIVEQAEKRAAEIGGDAYLALKEKHLLQQAVTAIKNVVEGYGDRYIIPTRSLLDDLAGDFGHTEAGQSLAAARDQSRRMVEQAQAADCEYAEANRRETAIRFVIDAFNGRVDAILSRTKHDNYGTLEREIRDAFSLVNLNGKAFRDARVLPAYLDARLSELKWAVVVHELRQKEREEQRLIKERIREEEKVRREYERAIQEAQKKEELIREAIEKTRSEVELATAEQRAKLEDRIAKLSQELANTASKTRALSMAQQTRAGHVYVISNLGAFGEDVFKIGMTRRLEPLDRIKELGDASVPFGFDVHAMIYSQDAPALEFLLHTEFDDRRINKINFRKEFFRLPLQKIRDLVSSKGMDVSFTMLAEASQWKETQAIERMTPEERQRYYERHHGEDDGLDG